MRDLFCWLCGEPVEIDYIQDMAEEKGVTYPSLVKSFMDNGCRALEGDKATWCAEDPRSNR